MFRLLHHFRQAVACLRQFPGATLVAIGTVAVALGMSGAAWLLERSVETALRSIGTEARITVFLKAGTKASNGLLVRAGAAGGPGSRVSFVSPDTALSRLKADLGKTGKALDDLAENPLPPSLEVRLGSAGKDLAKISSATARLRDLPETTDVDDGASFIHRLEEVLAAVRAVGAVLFLLVLAAALFLVGSVIRLTVDARRQEIDILRMVGATDSYIATPFALEGLLQGAFGGVFAALLVHIVELAGLPWAADAFGFGRDLLPAMLGWGAFVGMVAGGMIIGLLASLVTTLRFLRRAP